MEQQKTGILVKKLLKWLIPLSLILFIQLLKFFPSVIEKYYSTGLYVYMVTTLRTITGFIPFSIGDILYFIVLAGCAFTAIKFVIKLIKKEAQWKYSVLKLLQFIRRLLWVYITFYLLWGLNYYRSGITAQLHLKVENYSTEDLCNITNLLIDKTNKSRLALSKDSLLPQPAIKDIYQEAVTNYKGIASTFPFLHYKVKSVKRSLYTAFAPYFGFTGYYNPFSGEAQLRDDVPRILIPYTVSHEMAHQLGYASETEANFAGYLAAANSTDNYFKYSVYLDLYRYARIELMMRNVLPDNNYKLDSLVKMDLRNINRFFLKERNRVSGKVMNLYGMYLQANNQQKGINSYDDVISLLIAYYKQYGKI
jgi:hypothetical protein